MSTTELSSGREDTSIPKDVIALLAVLVLTATVMILNETSLSVAIPSLMREFSITAATAQWLITIFMLTMSVVIPTTGFLIQRFSTRQIYFASLALFIAGTTVGAAAPSFVILLLGRVLQAMGTALIIPLIMTVMMKTVPAQRRGTVMGFIGVVISVAPATGPSVGGIILQYFSWHGIFLCMLPLLVIAGLASAKVLSNVGDNIHEPIDLISVGLSVLAFGGMVYSLSSVEGVLESGGSITGLMILLAAALVALAVFGLRQIRLARDGRALLDLSPFLIRNFSLSIVITMMSFAMLIGTITMLPILVQNGLGDSARTAGLIVLPGGVAQGVMSPIIGRIYDRVGPKPLMIPGACLMSTGAWLFTQVSTDTAIIQLVMFHFVFAFGFGLMMTPMMTTALESLPDHLYSHGSAILNTLQQLSAAAGTAALMVVLTRVSQSAMDTGAGEAVATADGVGSAFFLGAIMVSCAIPLTLVITRPQRQAVPQASS